MTDIVKRLRRWVTFGTGIDELVLDARDAAVEIERLRAQNAVLMTAITEAAALMASAPVQKENDNGAS